jgi:hypothetical protein
MVKRKPAKEAGGETPAAKKIKSSAKSESKPASGGGLGGLVDYGSDSDSD